MIRFEEIIKSKRRGVIKVFSFSVHQNEVYAQPSELIVCIKTKILLNQGMVVLTSRVITILEFAKLIPTDLEVTFFTISLLVALELSEHGKLTVILIGGQLVHFFFKLSVS